MLNSKMNSFELLQKLTENYEAFQHERGPFLLTQLEKQWLAYQLENSRIFLDDATFEKLKELCKSETNIHTHLTVKGEKQAVPVNEEHLRLARELIENNSAMKIQYETKRGFTYEEIGVPLELQYSPAKNQWSLWWVRLAPTISIECCKRTPLQLINALAPCKATFEKAALTKQFYQSMEEKRSLKLAFTPLFPMDSQRFIHTFSIFEKRAVQEDQQLILEIFYYAEEEAFVLSKIRSFGPHVRLLHPQNLQQKISDSAKAAFDRYNKCP